MVRPADNEELVFPDGGCFGCSQSNDAGLALRFFRRGDSITADYTIPARFHGAPGVAHGGIVATILDEVSCAVIAALRDTHVVTGELTIRYDAPCPVDAPLQFRATVGDDTHPRYAVVDGELLMGDTRIASSTGKFFYVDRKSSSP